MLIFKPNNNKHADELEKDDPFFTHSHAIGPLEHTLCSIACEEWGNTDYTEKKKITCPDCIEMIKFCKRYKI